MKENAFYKKPLDKETNKSGTDPTLRYCKRNDSIRLWFDFQKFYHHTDCHRVRENLLRPCDKLAQGNNRPHAHL